MKLTEKEKQLISGALLAQMANISESIKSIAHTGDKSLTDLLTEHRKELAALNSKICEAMREDESESGEAAQEYIGDSYFEICAETDGNIQQLDNAWDEDHAKRQADDLADFFKAKTDKPDRIVVYEYKDTGICYAKEVE